MTTTRIRAAVCAVAFGTSGLTGVAAIAQDYPERSVEVIHQFGPGGGTDRFIRAIAEPFQSQTDESMVSISVTGGGGVPAAVNFMQRKADGYTLLGIGPEQVINHAMGRMPLDGVQPVARIQFDQGLFLVAADSPYQTIEDLIAAATENPGDLKVGVTGTAGFDDALVGLWNLESGAEVMTVPFAAAEMVSNTLGGHVDLMYEEYGPSRGLIESGDLRPLVLFADERLPVLPDVPTAKELGYDVSLGRWRGFAIKEGTDPEIVEALSGILSEAAQSESYKKVEEENALQYRSEYLGPEEFSAFVDEQIEIYTDVLTKLGYIGN